MSIRAPARPPVANPDGLATAAYDDVANDASAMVIRHYSTSFGLATRLLRGQVRTDIRNVYALVRLADELVDSPGPGATAGHQAAWLNGLEQETRRALEIGHSANLVVHAFAGTAARCGIERDLVSPFFESMRTDLQVARYDDDSFERYVYGSAEVVGLMCLRVFLSEPGADTQEYFALAPGAQRLGAAFQKLNFLRDLAEDFERLGRVYFPGVEPTRLDSTVRDRLLDDIDDDLRTAATAIPGLPAGSRRAVSAAHALFCELSRRLRKTPAATMRRQRVRVPDPAKIRIVATALLRGLW